MNLSFYCSGNVNAPVVMLLHGFLGSAKDWWSLMEFLKDDYYLIAIDL